MARVEPADVRFDREHVWAGWGIRGARLRGARLHLEDRDDAVFFLASQLGDEKDRVVIKSDGNPAYIAGDIAYLVDKRGRVMAVLNESPKLCAIHRTLGTGSLAKVVVTVALVRLAPVAPFSLTNVFMAAMRVSPLPYAAGTVIGMAPRNAPFFVSAGPDRNFLTLEDNLYSYEETPDRLPAAGQ